MNKTYSLIILNFLIVFQLIYKGFIDVNLYYIFIFFSFSYLMLKYKSLKINFEPLRPFLIYSFILLLFNLLISFDVNLIYYYFSIIWILAYLILKFNSGNIDVKLFLKWNFYFAVFVAFGGLIEFHISRDIFGLVPIIGFAELYENYDLYYRTRSFVWSPQINSLIIVFAIISTIEYKLVKNYYIYYLLLFVLIYAMFLTGSRTPVFCLIIYFISSINKSKFIKTLSIGSIFIFLTLLLSDFRQFDFLFSFNDFLESESANRIFKQLKVFENSNFLFGNSIGSTNANSTAYINSESYYLQIFSEYGGIGLFLIITAIYKLYIVKEKSSRKVLFPMIISGLFVHALSSPYLLPFWVLLLHPSIENNTLK